MYKDFILNKRWYDNFRSFAKQLERLKNVSSAQLDAVTKGIFAILEENDATHIRGDFLDASCTSDFIKAYAIDLYHKRWYDKDPYLWLIVNSLKYASPSVVEKISLYIEHTLSE